MGLGFSLCTAYLPPFVTSLVATSIWIWDPTLQHPKIYTTNYKINCHYNQQNIYFLLPRIQVFSTKSCGLTYENTFSLSDYWLLQQAHPFGFAFTAHLYREGKDITSSKGFIILVRAKDSIMVKVSIIIATIYQDKMRGYAAY